MNFVQNILWNSVEGFVEAGTRTAGGYAGDALIKAGDLIESGGRGVGGSIERAASGYGTKISGQNPSSTAKKAASRPGNLRSNSSPASTKAGSKVPIGAKKYPGGSIPGQKQITSGAKSTIGGAQKSIGGVTGGAQKSLGGVTGGLNKTIGGASKATGASIQKGTGIVGAGAKSLPKPFPNNTPFNSSSYSKPSGPKPGVEASKYPGSEKKAAVTQYRPKPFVAPVEQKKPAGAGGKPSYPGAGGKTAVKPGQYKPLPRLAGTAERGKVEHIAV